MTTSVHSTLTGADLHESKGVATALSGQVYVADGAGSGAWTAASSVITNTAFTTGDLKLTHKTAADTGWILWGNVAGNRTIGDGSSGGLVRANADTATLFALYWNNYSNTQCPVSGGRGVSAAADYAAHKTISLPPGMARALGVAGNPSDLPTNRNLGDSTGAETVILTTTNLPPYTPAGTNSTTSVLWADFGATDAASGTGLALSTLPGSSVVFTGTPQGGTSQPVSIMQPTAFVNVMIKL